MVRQSFCMLEKSVLSVQAMLLLMFLLHILLLSLARTEASTQESLTTGYANELESSGLHDSEVRAQPPVLMEDSSLEADGTGQEAEQNLEAAEDEGHAWQWEIGDEDALSLEARARIAEPLQLLRPTEGHDRFEIDPVAVAALESVEEPVAIVAAVGPYHGGKSFLLNVLLNSSRGFPVGTRPQPETQGLWLRLPPPSLLRAQDGARVLLLDTEGFYGAAAPRAYDAKVFALATLLSSHLVYNTLRTLGDLKSVSELADLAKHAHVFNLHNWLHSGSEGAEGGEPSPVGPDPLLLLRTLEFPPLTWVVQGFDVDLGPSDSATAHLQRYLSAHARSGDRSIDELFTEGVQCLSMRTPADLNRLREEVGGGGLGEERELFPMLHPAYKDDVERVRAAVLGKLRAKGGGAFTGRTLAKLLPILVHYVNEDFPFNAEKPVQETVRGLLLDSGLEGGTAYFRALLERGLGQQPSRRKGGAGLQRGDRGGFEGGKGVVEVGRVSEQVVSLVARALTPGELDKAMNSAEERAVQYCGQRCVGLPPETVRPVCSAALPMRLQHLRPAYEAENEKRVKEALVALAAGLQLAAHERLEALPLPVPEAELDRLCSGLLKSALAEYDRGVGKHRGGELYSQGKARLVGEMKARCRDVSGHNSARIGSLLEAAQGTYRQTYNKVMGEGRAVPSQDSGERGGGLGKADAGARPEDRRTRAGPGPGPGGGVGVGVGVEAGAQGKGGEEGRRREGEGAAGNGGGGGEERGGPGGGMALKQLQGLHARAREEAEKAFAAVVGRGGLSWVGPGHRPYEFHRFENQEWSKGRFEEIQEANAARVAALCSRAALALTQRSRRELQRFRPFPDNDEVLAAKIAEVSKTLQAEYSAQVAAFAGMAAVEEGRRELQGAVEAARAHLLEKNTRLMTALCYEPLQAASRDLRMHECEKTYDNVFVTGVWWAPRCLFPGPRLVPGFTQAAYRAARHHLDKAQLGLRTSPQPDPHRTHSQPDSKAEALGGSLDPQLGEAGAKGEDAERFRAEKLNGGAAVERGSGDGEEEGVQLSSSLSVGTRHKVIRSWIEHDLAGHVLTVTTNFALLASCGTGILGVLWWVGLRPEFGAVARKPGR